MAARLSTLDDCRNTLSRACTESTIVAPEPPMPASYPRLSPQASGSAAPSLGDRRATGDASACLSLTATSDGGSDPSRRERACQGSVRTIGSRWRIFMDPSEPRRWLPGLWLRWLLTPPVLLAWLAMLCRLETVRNVARLRPL